MARAVRHDGYATIGLVSSIDSEQVARRLGAVVPARTVGGILVALALLTLAQDASGALVTAFAVEAPIDPAARHLWIADLAFDAPAVLAGGVLLWQRRPLGYVAGAGLLLQYGLTPLGLVAAMALRTGVTASSIDVATSLALLAFSAVCFAPLPFSFTGARRRQAVV